jgi:hypothetical protein
MKKLTQVGAQTQELDFDKVVNILHDTYGFKVLRNGIISAYIESSLEDGIDVDGIVNYITYEFYLK